MLLQFCFGLDQPELVRCGKGVCHVITILLWAWSTGTGTGCVPGSSGRAYGFTFLQRGSLTQRGLHSLLISAALSVCLPFFVCFSGLKSGLGPCAAAGCRLENFYARGT